MAILFPSDPSIGETFTAVGKTWTWNGAQWEGVPAVVNVGTPSGETGDRPSTPSVGDTFYNGTLGVLEIYTSSGWLPATGANDFNVVLTGSETSVTLDKEYFAGAYTISSALSDATFDVYLFDTSNNAAGYSKTPSINATSNFNKILVYGGTDGDLLSFSYKTTFTTSVTTTDTFAAPYIASVSVSSLANTDDTTTITGGNFATDIEVWFDGENDYSLQAKSVVYGSSTSIVATRPDNMPAENNPYFVRVVNPGTASPSPEGSNRHKFAITAGSGLSWTTAAGLLDTIPAAQAYSKILQLSDPDQGSITYSLDSGVLPGGLSLNSSTGEISGIPNSISDADFVISATDQGGNSISRSFSIKVNLASGGSVQDIGGYRIHTFNSSGTFELFADSNLDFLIVGGGGGGAGAFAGGGGGGGIVHGESVLTSAQAYPIVVGAGGLGGLGWQNSADMAGSNGSNSSFNGFSGNGGGGGGIFGGNSGSYTPAVPGKPGGSGGGGGSWHNNTSDPTYADGGYLGGASNQPSYATTGVTSYGGDGGNGGSAYPGGGGGGAGGIKPATPSGLSGGDGADGASFDISGQSTYYGGGGGGSNQNGSGRFGGTGGLGGGTTASTLSASVGELDADPNTGGGAAASGYNQSSSDRIGGSGGSGLVIVRYPI